MSLRRFFFSKSLVAISFFPFFLGASTVDMISDDETVVNSLPHAILTSVAGETIDFAPGIQGMTILLTKPLPAITHSLIIDGGTGMTIDGAGMYQAFSVAAGPLSMNNITVMNSVSLGGAGGMGITGGGGGVGGGGGLYIHNGATVTLSTVNLTGNTAQGGAGGASGGLAGGGGGGGFGGGAGGANGGGGGGNSGGGAGGSGAAGADGLFFGGAGGGATGLDGGDANNQGMLMPMSTFTGGTSGVSLGGGGGAGSGGNGTIASTTAGGSGGIGLGANTLFGGGGGGGGFTAGAGGAGFGSGGGGGAGSGGTGGAGGSFGGGGGGGASGIGGQGGFGAGGGGGTTEGTSIFGGGSGAVNGGGGGGAGLGGGVFISAGATLNVNDGNTISGNSAVAGVGGTGAAGGTALGTDFFLQSGGFLNFNLTAMPLTIASNIASDQLAGGGTGGGVTLQGTQVLTLSGNNTYTGGTNIVSGTLRANSNASLGDPNFSVVIQNGTLQAGSSFTIPRTISLTGAATIDGDGNNLNLTGVITGGGSVNFIGMNSTITLSAANTYSGGTTVGSMTTLIGNTTSLQGNINALAMSNVTFNQSGSGTYSGALSGQGTVNLQGNGVFQMTGTGPGFTGTLNVLPNIQLQMLGAIPNSSTVISMGASISGTGTVGNLNNSGVINPGNNGVGTLSVNGTLTLQPSSQLQILLTPSGQNNVLAVSGSATLDGNVHFTPAPGFYGFGNSYTFVTTGAPLMTMFSSATFAPFSNPTATGSIVYTQDATLIVRVAEPFFGFPYENQNERAVGENIDALNSQGLLTPGLFMLFNELQGYSFSTINHVLNELHPAPYSAWDDVQPQLGGQILSMYHKNPRLSCRCYQDHSLWVVPFSNWLKQGNKGEQFGFESISQGIAVGCDRAVGENWVLGLGGLWNESDLTLHSGIGSGSADRYFGAFYIDYMIDSFYMGISGYGGWGDYHMTRHVHFPFATFYPKGEFQTIEAAGQLQIAWLMGAPAAYFYPYANADFFYMHYRSFTEKDGGAINLSVENRSVQSVRTEAGFAFQIQDTNDSETACISPLFGMGWAMECPISRPHFKAYFADEPIGFFARGWNHTWHLLTLDFGLQISYVNFTVFGSYHADMSLQGRSDFWGQRGEVGLNIGW